MKKTLVSMTLFSIGCFVLVMPASAENITTYSDEILTFDYDADFEAGIFRYDFSVSLESLPTVYQAEVNMVENEEVSDSGFSVHVASIDAFSQKYGDWKKVILLESDEQHELKSFDVISDGDLPEVLFCIDSEEYGEYSFYRKLLGYNDDYFLFADYQPSNDNADQNSFLKTMYDSVQVSEDFLNNKYSPSEEYNRTVILSNVVFSDQAINYAKELIRIGQGYLDFSISSDDAQKQVKDVFDRFTNYCDSSEYKYDSDLRHTAYGMDMDISLKKDSDILKIVQELQDLIDTQE